MEFNDIRVKDLDAHTFTPVNDLKDMALKETVIKVIGIFRKHIGGKIDEDKKTEIQLKINKVSSKNLVSFHVAERTPNQINKKKELTYVYKDKGKVYAKETLVEDDVISKVIKFNDKQISYLESLIETRRFLIPFLDNTPASNLYIQDHCCDLNLILSDLLPHHNTLFFPFFERSSYIFLRAS